MLRVEKIIQFGFMSLWVTNNLLLYLQQRGLILGELLQLLQRLPEESGSGEDQQALLRSLWKEKLSFTPLDLLQCSPDRLHIGLDHLQNHEQINTRV